MALSITIFFVSYDTSDENVKNSCHKFLSLFLQGVRKFLSYVEVILDVDDPMKTAELEAIQLRFEQLRNLLLLFSHSYKELDDINDLGYVVSYVTYCFNHNFQQVVYN